MKRIENRMELSKRSEYEDRPLWQIFLIFIVILLIIGMFIISVYYVIAKIDKNMNPDGYTMIRTSQNNNYVETTSESKCYKNGLEVNCTLIPSGIDRLT